MKTWYNDWHYWVGVIIVWCGINALTGNIPADLKFWLCDFVIALGLMIMYYNDRTQ